MRARSGCPSGHHQGPPPSPAAHGVRRGCWTRVIRPDWWRRCRTSANSRRVGACGDSIVRGNHVLPYCRFYYTGILASLQPCSADVPGQLLSVIASSSIISNSASTISLTPKACASRCRQDNRGIMLQPNTHLLTGHIDQTHHQQEVLLVSMSHRGVDARSRHRAPECSSAASIWCPAPHAVLQHFDDHRCG